MNGKVIGSFLPRHRGREFVKFLNLNWKRRCHLYGRYFPCLLEKGSIEWQECIDLGIRLHEQHSNVLRSGCYPQVVDKMVRYHSAINRQILQAITQLQRSRVKRRSQAEAE
jgi:hypothetical protein